MADTIRELLVALGVDAGDADKQVAQLDDALTDLKDVMLGAVAVAAAVTAAIAGVAVSASDAAGAVADGAARTGLATRAYQELGYAAKQTGSSVEELEAGLTAQNRAVQAAIDAGDRQIEVAKGVELSLYDTNGALLTQEQLLYRASDAIASARSEQESLAIATSMYGRGGAALLPMLKAGSAGLGTMAKRAEALGIVMSDASIAVGDEFGDKLDDVTGLVAGLKNAIGVMLLPTLTDMLVRFSDWYQANREVIGQKLEKWVGVVIAGLELLEEAVVNVNAAVQTIGGWETIFLALAAAGSVVAAVWGGAQMVKAWGAIGALVEVLKVGLAAGASAAGLVVGDFALIVGAVALAALQAAAAIGSIVLVVQDLWTYMQGGDSVFGRLLARFGEAPGIIGALVRSTSAWLQLLQALGEAVSVVGSTVSDVFGIVLAPVIQAFGELFGETFTNMADVANWALGGIAAYIDSMTQKLLDFVNIVRGLGLSAGLVGVGARADTVGVARTEQGAFAAVGRGLAGASESASAMARFAPTAAEVAGKVEQSRQALSPSLINIYGNTYQISGAGLEKDEIIDLIRQSENERARATAAALEGGEV